MILAVDVDYGDTSALVAGVAFSEWEDIEPQHVFTSVIDDIQEYQPGNFYKRELPCILQLLEDHKLKPEVILVDGYVFLDGSKVSGLGKHLFDSLDEATVVIGIAKRRFKDISSEYAVYRGESKNPLYVTSIGIDIELAKKVVSNMYGQYRIPDLLKKADQVCRGRC